MLGLGNPGRAYEKTRHNLGAVAIAEAASRHGTPLVPNTRCKALLAEIKLGSEVVALAFPQTYVNNSGQALRGLVRKYPIASPESLLVVHDELDLPPGVVRVKKGGGVAGHNGLKSIVAFYGSSDFVRIRIGIGRPMASGAIVDYVLAVPPPKERESLIAGVSTAVDAIEEILLNGVEAAMNRFNIR
ncbi:MAG: aminoacyl-tRNA hydrolase [Actinomycetota bacterium]|nr:aminoacyl-tRNA hydrolase [Actinomycetota bacterium]